MEAFYIDLNEMTNKKTKLYKIWAFGAIVFLVLAIVSVAFFQKRFGKAEWPIVIMAVYFALYVYYAWITYKAKLYIKSDEYALEYSFGMLKRTSEAIIWDTIVKVKLGPTYIAFYKRSGKRKVIRLGWLPYAKVVEIKDSICKMSEFKSIPCERAEYQHFESK
ncbi:MAG: hypothetical protein H6536_04545 [Bacteroidales bacterium]|nr:hypothetical protein [Bacteroidales bacterium]